MSFRISASVGSYESGAKNNSADIASVQMMLAVVSHKLTNINFRMRDMDGRIKKPGAVCPTVQAITAFQRFHVGLNRPDQLIEVNGKTWNKLSQTYERFFRIQQGTVKSDVTLTIKHDDKWPTKTTRQDKTLEPTYNGMYESTFTLSGGLTGRFRGSIWPDNMTIKGRVVDGTYPLHIGFHKGGNQTKQKESDLVVKTRNIRPGLLVNCRNSISVTSDNANKLTSSGINVHNGQYNSRGSDGCFTLHPDDWSDFIQLFLDGFPDIDDWHKEYTNTGKKIGSVVVQA
ncbi:MAG: hypothetical protein WDZ51_07515 [Pirellulaceae bacterium]